MTKIIIAGGRDFKPRGPERVRWEARLGRELLNRKPSEVVSGMAQGADAFGEAMARRLSIPVKGFPAMWQLHGRAAGPIRNAQMAEYADMLIALPGGSGTADMVKQMTERGKPVLDWRMGL